MPRVVTQNCAVRQNQMAIVQATTLIAAAVMFHIVGTLPVLVTGLVLFAATGVRMRDLKSL